jgi:hypothetical protein
MKKIMFASLLSLTLASCSHFGGHKSCCDKKEGKSECKTTQCPVDKKAEKKGPCCDKKAKEKA